MHVYRRNLTIDLNIHPGDAYFGDLSSAPNIVQRLPITIKNRDLRDLKNVSSAKQSGASVTISPRKMGNKLLIVHFQGRS